MHCCYSATLPGDSYKVALTCFSKFFYTLHDQVLAILCPFWDARLIVDDSTSTGNENVLIMQTKKYPISWAHLDNS